MGPYAGGYAQSTVTEAAQTKKGGIAVDWIDYALVWFGLFLALYLWAEWAKRRNRREAVQRRAWRRWIESQYGK